MGSFFIWRGVICGALWCFVVLCGALWCFVVCFIAYHFINIYRFISIFLLFLFKSCFTNCEASFIKAVL